MGTKVYIIGSGHMTKMAAMLIYGKIISKTISYMTVKVNRPQKRLVPYKNYINDDPGLTLTSFMASSNLFP